MAGAGIVPNRHRLKIAANNCVNRRRTPPGLKWDSIRVRPGYADRSLTKALVNVHPWKALDLATYTPLGQRFCTLDTQ